jgi:type 1 glutamine amidotransferase
MKILGINISRRSLFRSAGLAAGVGLLGLTSSKSDQSPQPFPARSGGKPRALALIGDRFHNPDYIRVSLDKVFKDLGIPIDYTIQYDQISASLLKNYQLLLILRDGMIWPDGYLGPDAYTDYEANLETPKTFANPTSVAWITEEQGAAIKDFVSGGNGFYALHNCSNISLSSKNYRDVMGGAYISHPPLRPFQVRATANKHPITEGITPFVVNDEQHYVDYDKDPKYVILEAENIDGLAFQNLGTKSISGWAYDFGQGRVVFTAVGHTIHAMWAPQYIEIQKRSIRWLLKEL